jgi:23S rRNA (cytosine1962-C5)-methyltransferase
MGRIRLRTGHVQPVWAGHPWVYAQAIDQIEGGPVRGDEVEVVDPRGNFLGRGFYTPGSSIPVRLLVRDQTTRIDLDLFRARIRQAVHLRTSVGLPSKGTSGYRLVHAEGDGLPGLIVDHFGDSLVLQMSTFGMKAREGTILEALTAELAPRSIIDRSPANAAKIENFVPGSGVIHGEPTELLEFEEREIKYRLPLDLGQKTGFYFDQRALRGRVEQLAHGRRVLDAYSYVGSFALAAARGGAKHVTAVDDSAVAIEVGAEIALANGFADRIAFTKADARRFLQNAHEAGGRYDLVIVDPPRFAPSRGARDQALVAYAKTAEMACRAVEPGGLLVICSCSAAVDINMLTRALASGALRANVQATVLERWFQGADHPVLAAFPEGLYLKALIARVGAR